MLLRTLFFASLFLGCGDSTASPPGADGGSAACDASLTDDPNNCGACGRVCPHLVGTAASCREGACVYECVAGFDDCDGDLGTSASNGCEADVERDPLHCGECGRSCPSALPNATGSCSAGECGIRCAAGFGDCDLDLLRPESNGCEIDVTDDPMHCGLCNNACAGSCAAMTCEGDTPSCGFVADVIEHPVSVQLASDGATFLAAFNDLALSKLYVFALDAAGRQAGPAREVGDFESWWRFDLEYDGTSFVLAWEDETLEGIFAQRFDASAAPMGDATRIADGATNTLRLASAPGEVIATADGWGVRWRAAVTTSFETPGDYFALTVATAEGYAAVGTVEVPPTTERPYMYQSLDYASYDGELALRTRGPLDRSLHLASGARAHLVSLGDGALLAVPGSMMVFGVPELMLLSFDRRGAPAGGATPTWRRVGGMSIGALGIAPRDASSVWFAATDNNPFMRAPVLVGAMSSTGSVLAGPHTVASPRSGFISELALAKNDRGVLVTWVWRSGAGGEDLHAIEGAFMRTDGTLEPCAP